MKNEREVSTMMSRVVSLNDRFVHCSSLKREIGEAIVEAENGYLLFLNRRYPVDMFEFNKFPELNHIKEALEESIDSLAINGSVNKQETYAYFPDREISSFNTDCLIDLADFKDKYLNDYKLDVNSTYFYLTYNQEKLPDYIDERLDMFELLKEIYSFASNPIIQSVLISISDTPQQGLRPLLERILRENGNDYEVARTVTVIGKLHEEDINGSLYMKNMKSQLQLNGIKYNEAKKKEKEAIHRVMMNVFDIPDSRKAQNTVTYDPYDVVGFDFDPSKISPEIHKPFNKRQIPFVSKIHPKEHFLLDLHEIDDSNNMVIIEGSKEYQLAKQIMLRDTMLNGTKNVIFDGHYKMRTFVEKIDGEVVEFFRNPYEKQHFLNLFDDVDDSSYYSFKNNIDTLIRAAWSEKSSNVMVYVRDALYQALENDSISLSSLTLEKLIDMAVMSYKSTNADNKDAQDAYYVLHLMKNQLRDNDLSIFLKETTINFSNPFVYFEAAHASKSIKVASKLIMHYFMRRFGQDCHIRFWFFDYPEDMVEQGKVYRAHKERNFSVAYVTNNLKADIQGLNATHFFVDSYVDKGSLKYLPKSERLHDKKSLGGLYINKTLNYYDETTFFKFVGDKERELLSNRTYQR